VALQISFTQKQQKLLPTFWKIVIAVINAWIKKNSTPECWCCLAFLNIVAQIASTYQFYFEVISFHVTLYSSSKTFSYLFIRWNVASWLAVLLVVPHWRV
jgi:hypothetical protein